MSRKNIIISPLEENSSITLSEELSVSPFIVPHRDEFSETVGYRIQGPNKAALFMPDIDKWEKWETDIVREIESVDYAFLDATFYSGQEMNNRDISEIPHPFVIESMDKFIGLPMKDKNKIFFIHFNHTNPLLDAESKEAQAVLAAGYNIARAYDRFKM